MEKNRDIEKYINTVKDNKDFFKQYYYHSLIDLNLIKLDMILEYGILSKRMIELKRLADVYTHHCDSFDSKNGNDFVSLSEYNDDCRFSLLLDSFALHTLTSLSLMVDKDIEVSKKGARMTYFSDEVFCYKYIDKSKISGILLPEHLSNLSIGEVNCLPCDFSCYSKVYINHWLKCMENYFGYKIPNSYIEELKESYNQLSKIISEYESPEKWIESIIRTQRKQYGKDIKDILANILDYLWSLKYGLENPKYLDIVMLLNKDNLPVYEVNEKCLRKVI